MVKNEDLEDYKDMVKESELKNKTKLEYFFGAYEKSKQKGKSIVTFADDVIEETSRPKSSHNLIKTLPLNKENDLYMDFDQQDNNQGSKKWNGLASYILQNKVELGLLVDKLSRKTDDQPKRRSTIFYDPEQVLNMMSKQNQFKYNPQNKYKSRNRNMYINGSKTARLSNTRENQQNQNLDIKSNNQASHTKLHIKKLSESSSNFKLKLNQTTLEQISSNHYQQNQIRNKASQKLRLELNTGERSSRLFQKDLQEKIQLYKEQRQKSQRDRLKIVLPQNDQLFEHKEEDLIQKIQHQQPELNFQNPLRSARMAQQSALKLQNDPNYSPTVKEAINKTIGQNYLKFHQPNTQLTTMDSLKKVYQNEAKSPLFFHNKRRSLNDTAFKKSYLNQRLPMKNNLLQNSIPGTSNQNEI
eukprot:403372120